MPLYCSNCNRLGHRFKECWHPVNSYGMIIYRVLNGTIQYLLVQRRWSFAYMEFLCAKYIKDGKADYAYLKKLIQLLPIVERQCLLKHSFDHLWESLWQWSNKPDGQFAQTHFCKIRPMLNYFFSKIPALYIEPEWGFPKGRRDYHETDLTCAIREVHEETGLTPAMYHLHQHVIPYKEDIKAINNVEYCQKYYLACLPTTISPILYRPYNSRQLCEIRKIGWFTLPQIQRMYMTDSKRTILQKVQHLVRRLITK